MTQGHEREASPPARYGFWAHWYMTEMNSQNDNGSESSSSSRRITPTTVALGFAAIFSITFAHLWIRAFMQMSRHGFDISDEGYYLLAYRWWSVNHRTFTGSQYLYGPVFQLLRYDIARLRLFRLFTIVGTHGLFGVAFMQWLRLRRPRAPRSVLWEVTGTAAIVAAGGLACSWMALSPGYNDVSLLGAILATAFALRVATLVEQNLRVPAWLPMAFGALVVMMVLAKWASSIATLGPVVLVAVITVISAKGARAGTRELSRLAGWTIAGAATFLLLFNIFIVRLDKVMPEILEVTRLLVKKGNSPTVLLAMYWDTGLKVLKETVERHELLIIAAAMAVVGRRREAQIFTGLLVICAVYRSVARVEDGAGLVGGPSNLSRFSITIQAIALATLTMAGVTLLVGWMGRRRLPSLCRESRCGWAMLGLLVILPITQGLGTGNPIYMMVNNGFGCWMAVIIAVATGIETAPFVARVFGVVLAASGIVSSVLITRSGVLEHPYRTEGFAQTTTIASGVPALHSVKLRPDVAQGFNNLHRALQPYIEPSGRAMMGFDEMSGILLAMGGRPIGEAWASALDWERTAEGLRASCRGGHPWWESRWPVLLFKRPVSDVERRALSDCGIDFEKDYRLLAPSSQTSGITVYVPANEGVALVPSHDRPSP